VALFGPAGVDAIQILNMLTVTAGVLLMLLTTAYNPAGNRLIVVPLFLAILTVARIHYGYLRNASGSLWPVVIAHGTFNAVLGAWPAQRWSATRPPPPTSPGRLACSPCWHSSLWRGSW
jgi:membrane protease YdiL (CAAX protease family)